MTRTQIWSRSLIVKKVELTVTDCCVFKLLGAKVPVLRLIQGSDGSVEALLAACQRQAVAFQAVLFSSADKCCAVRRGARWTCSDCLCGWPCPFFCFRNYLIACFLLGRVMSLYLGLPIMNSPTEHSLLPDIPETCSNNSLLPKLSPHGASPSAVATR